MRHAGEPGSERASRDMGMALTSLVPELDEELHELHGQRRAGVAEAPRLTRGSCRSLSLPREHMLTGGCDGLAPGLDGELHELHGQRRD